MSERLPPSPRRPGPLARLHSALAREAPPTLSLGLPVAVGQLGMMAMHVVDTAMVGPLGPEAVGAVGLGGAFYALVFSLGFGLLLGLDRVVSFAFGARRFTECRRSLVQGLWLATLLSGPLAGLLLALSLLLPAFGVAAEVIPGATVYLQALTWSVWPGLLFTALRQALQATGDTRFATAILLAANVVNAAANAVLIHGALGWTGLGVAGAGYATLASRVFMLVALTGWLLWRGIARQPGAVDGGEPVSLLPDPGRLREIVTVGAPAAGHQVLEFGVFSLATVLVAGLGAVPLAAHHVVLLVSSVTFMVPLGISAAGAVRVGQALGRGDLPGARAAGWGSVALGVGVMSVFAVLIVAGAEPILRMFTSDPEVVSLGRTLLLLTALFQLFDGAQVTLTGALRGTGDTRTPMLANLVAHWAIGFPVGATLCYAGGWGAAGLWAGLALGIAAAAALLVRAWQRRAEALAVPAL